MTVEERFAWKTIREVRIDCYKQALKLATALKLLLQSRYNLWLGALAQSVRAMES